ncbi:histidinol phosphate phosphatase domain-containing protein [Thermodesulfobacteriota bacterium]
MIDLHSHSVFSDGVLIPAELVRRYESYGYEALAITDHADSSNLDFIIPRIIKVCDDLNRTQSVLVIPGIEITHAPPALIPDLVKAARELGAKIVVLHGETVTEPVAPGTNRVGIEAGIDILAHPGLLTPEDAGLAVENNVFLEITARSGHNITNGHVAKVAEAAGAGMVLNSDCHEPCDIMSKELAENTVKGAGLAGDSFSALLSNSRQLLERAGYNL